MTGSHKFLEAPIVHARELINRSGNIKYSHAFIPAKFGTSLPGNYYMYNDEYSFEYLRVIEWKVIGLPVVTSVAASFYLPPLDHAKIQEQNLDVYYHYACKMDGEWTPHQDATQIFQAGSEKVYFYIDPMGVIKKHELQQIKNNQMIVTELIPTTSVIMKPELFSEKLDRILDEAINPYIATIQDTDLIFVNSSHSVGFPRRHTPWHLLPLNKKLSKLPPDTKPQMKKLYEECWSVRLTTRIQSEVLIQLSHPHLTLKNYTMGEYAKHMFEITKIQLQTLSKLHITNNEKELEKIHKKREALEKLIVMKNSKTNNYKLKLKIMKKTTY